MHACTHTQKLILDDTYMVISIS